MVGNGPSLCPAGEGGGGRGPASDRTQEVSQSPLRQSGFCPGEDVVGIADWYLPVGKGLKCSRVV